MTQLNNYWKFKNALIKEIVEQLLEVQERADKRNERHLREYSGAIEKQLRAQGRDIRGMRKDLRGYLEKTQAPVTQVVPAVTPEAPRTVSPAAITTTVPTQEEIQLKGILDKYKLPKWGVNEYINPVTGIGFKLHSYADEIQKAYSGNLQLLGKVILHARDKEKLNPAEYAAFIMAGLDERHEKSKIQGVTFTPEELQALHYI